MNTPVSPAPKSSSTASARKTAPTPPASSSHRLLTDEEVLAEGRAALRYLAAHPFNFTPTR